MTTIRPVNLPTDEPALLQLDTTFTTDRIYRVDATPASFVLVETPVTPPLRKSFPLDNELGAERLWDAGFVAETAGVIGGFLALRHEAWSRRTTIWHLYVDPARRGVGVGRQLIETARSIAQGHGSRCLWLEVTSVNYPAIQFYQRVGFRFCGLDTSLYDPAGEAAGETALYFAMDLS
jgi:ribosomal protein S18 acetylase RimI-like enzyme